MFITLRNGENILVEATRGKLLLKSDNMGNMTFEGASKVASIEDLEYNKLIEQMRQKWLKDFPTDTERTEKCIANIKEYVERLSKGLRLDKTTILNALERHRTYSFLNFYSKSNLAKFDSMEALEKKNGEINTNMWSMKQGYEEEITKLKKQIQEAHKINVKKLVAEGQAHSDYGINCHCPFCESWQEVDTSDWYPNDGEFEGNQECGSCGKWFTVECDGEM